MGRVKTELLDERDRHLHHQEEESFGYPAGWYFSDETEDWNGPYVTKELARAALDKYIEYLESHQ